MPPRSSEGNRLFDSPDHAYLRIRTRPLFWEAVFVHCPEAAHELTQCQGRVDVEKWAQSHAIDVPWIVRSAGLAVERLSLTGEVESTQPSVDLLALIRGALDELGAAGLEDTDDEKTFEELLLTSVFAYTDSATFEISLPNPITETWVQFRSRVLKKADEVWKASADSFKGMRQVAARPNLVSHCEWTARYYVGNELPKDIAPRSEKAVEAAIGAMRRLLPLPEKRNRGRRRLRGKS